MAEKSDDFFEALDQLNGLTERCQECHKPISLEEAQNNWASCDMCLDQAYEEFYQEQADKAQREWEAQEYERLERDGQI